MKLNTVFRLFCLSLAFLILNSSFDASAQRRRERKRERRNANARDKNIKTDKLPTAFAVTWQFASDDTMRFPALPDGESVYLPLGDGRVIALDSKSGELRWETPPSGAIVAPLASAGEALFIASRRGSAAGSEERSEQSSGSEQSGGILRAVNKRLGLSLWSKDFPEPFSAPMAIEDKYVYAASADRNLYALSREDGAIAWKASLDSIAYGKPLVDLDEIFIGTEAGAVIALGKADGKILWRAQAAGAVRGSVAADDEGVYCGDGDGYVYGLERKTGKRLWKARVGAAIESAPAIAEKLLLVSSFDNFVYGIDLKNGDRRWKVRLQGRLSFDPLFNGESLIFAPLAGDRLVTVSTKGRVLGQFRLESGEIIAPPSFEDDFLYIVTDEGLTAALALDFEAPKNK